MSIDLSERAALIADMSLVVRARFVEAADTLAHMQVRGTRPAETSGVWPAVPTVVDQDYRAPYRPNPAAISRMEEVMQRWLLDFVMDQEHRVLLGRWSASLAVPRIVGSFRAWCKKTGRVRRTAERRVDAAFQAIAAALLQNAQSLQHPSWQRVSPLLPEWGRDIDMVAERVAEQRETYWRADDAKPTDLPEERDMEWAERQNARRQAARERAERDKAA